MKKILFLLLIVFCMWSCSDETDTPFSISVDKYNVDVNSQSNTIPISVISNGKWQLITSSSWFSCSINEGDGNATFTIDVQENTTNEERVGTISLSKLNGSTTDQSTKITITQSQNDVIKVTNDEIDCLWSGGVYELSFETNVLPEVIIPNGIDWIHIATSNNMLKALVKRSVHLMIDENTGDERECSIKLEGGNASKEIKVKQDAFVSLESISLSESSELMITDINPHKLVVTVYPENASDKELIWTINDKSIAKLNGDDNNSKDIVAVSNGSTTLTVSNPRTGITKTISIIVKVKANRIIVNHDEEYGNYGYIFNREIKITPSIAFNDLVIESDDENIVSYQNGHFICGNKTGETIVRIKLPYSNLSESFPVIVKEFYAKAGISHVTQMNNQLDMSFAGHLYSKNANDIFIINNVSLCDGDGKAIFSSLYSTNSVQIYRNSTNDVAFGTGVVDLTTYGFYIIDQEVFYPFISKWFFNVTFKHSYSGDLQSTRIYINPYDWSENVDPVL